jgi:hypothetical protein
MGWRVRRSVKIAPGVRWNVGKTGSSLSVGGKGLTANVSKKGVRTTASIPGTGVSYSSMSKSAPKTKKAAPVPQLEERPQRGFFGKVWRLIWWLIKATIVLTIVLVVIGLIVGP